MTVKVVGPLDDDKVKKTLNRCQDYGETEFFASFASTEHTGQISETVMTSVSEKEKLKQI